MITFVYCCICLLIVCCHTTRTESEEFHSNDSPILPQRETLRPKPGEDVVMKCNKNIDNITWEFKRCQPGNLSDDKSMYKLDYSEGEWKKLDYNKKRKNLKIKNATEENTGFYRCLYNNSIMKIYILDLAATSRSLGPAPKVISLTPSSSSPIRANTPLAIQCKVSSVQPAEIRWFKECNGLINFDVEYDHKHYCHLNSSNSVSLSNNIYLSKLIIHNSRYVDSGTYVCVVINGFDEDHKNITIKIYDVMQSHYENKRNSFSLLFLIPLLLISVPALIWLCFNRRKKKNRQRFSEHQKQLIKPNVEFDIVVNVDDVV